jgi:NAD(P)H-hydrate repair Nnr-like enzyme with NAD(P)H-hydrate dehydratase domain
VGAWYHPSNGISGNGLVANQVAYSALTASVSGSGLVTALHVGETIVEVQFPTFDDVMTPETDSDTGNPTMMIYAQVRVIVIP